MNGKEEKGTVKEEFIIPPFKEESQETKKVDEPGHEVLPQIESLASG